MEDDGEQRRHAAVGEEQPPSNSEPALSISARKEREGDLLENTTNNAAAIAIAITKPIAPRMDFSRVVEIPEKQCSIVVFVTPFRGIKPFIGGYRHRISGLICYNAQTQTDPLPRRKTNPSSDESTQTNAWDCPRFRSQATQTVVSTGTQMPTAGVYIDESSDRVIVPRPYMTTEELDRKQNEAATTIQGAARIFLARKKLKQLRNEKLRLQEYMATMPEKESVTSEISLTNLLDCRRSPETLADFASMVKKVEEWKFREVEKINTASLSDMERRKALSALFREYTKYLQTIERMKHDCSPQLQYNKVQKMLSKMAAPKVITASDGKRILVETPEIKHAQHLWQLYNQLIQPDIIAEARTEILNSVAEIVTQFPAPPTTQEIIALVDREAVLTSRGVNVKNMEGLRKRLAHMFLRYIQTPEVNPQAALVRQLIKEHKL